MVLVLVVAVVVGVGVGVVMVVVMAVAVAVAVPPEALNHKSVLMQELVLMHESSRVRDPSLASKPFKPLESPRSIYRTPKRPDLGEQRRASSAHASLVPITLEKKRLRSGARRAGRASG